MAKGKRRVTGSGWRQVAPLVPLALFASAFTVSATDDPAVATAALEQGAGTNTPVVVPKQPIADPANIPVPGKVGNGVGKTEQPTQVVSGLSRNGIPTAALKAYSRAQQVLAQADADCRLPWTLVAAIGRVESNHGRFGGNSLTKDGIAVPGIYGPRLDGSITARISDSDAGRLDGDGAFDRAVGPMQFIPATWHAMGVDGDGDGTRNPQDIDDAAMSTGVYLCSGGSDLSKAADLNQAVLRYNHSQAYVDLVLSIAKAYAGGSWIVVGNGTTSDDQGVVRADGSIDDPTVDAPADENLPEAIDLPVYPPGKPRPTPTGGDGDQDRPTTSPTRKPPAKPSTPPRSTAKPTPSKPATPKPSTPPPSTPAGVATLKTAAGLIVGTVGSTLTELTKATQYCQNEMAKVTITKPTQDQLQKCVTAYQTGGTAAVDQVIRNLLSLLGLVGVLGGGLLGS
ncbi:Membrane-bound lytic murein transglycosylase B-like protein [Kribbella flavida DSM 17836]|uniref:Membrane-bound lytic murein transglycosylase B-like protein n=1 Tax=Kribbella flavida (strain DSM 17836 / JCM 10339 / NBRC 14399) TaxID=479435 RepID=D2PWV3_KRIFD|nr:lytic transglycosylase domain-containing protein [Kribbella flavida]ADB35333.1 Membrane-bound lytic murein transglycosylase B-like protein [Kribbella flavida DSM 17836]